MSARRPASPPLCLHCKRNPATPDLSRALLALASIERRSDDVPDPRISESRPGSDPSAGASTPTKQELKRFMERRRAEVRRGPRFFCDECRAEGSVLRCADPGIPRAPKCSDDELLVLVFAVTIGLDPVAVLWSAVQREERRLKRKGYVLPGLRARTTRATERTWDALDVIRGGQGETAAQEARRTGKTPAAIRNRRLRARKRLGRK